MCSLSKQAQGGCDYFCEYPAYYQVVPQWEKWSTLMIILLLPETMLFTNQGGTSVYTSDV